MKIETAFSETTLLIVSIYVTSRQIEKNDIKYLKHLVEIYWYIVEAKQLSAISADEKNICKKLFNVEKVIMLFKL